jgi:hypothetical protein
MDLATQQAWHPDRVYQGRKALRGSHQKMSVPEAWLLNKTTEDCVLGFIKRAMWLASRLERMLLAQKSGGYKNIFQRADRSFAPGGSHCRP